ncbi:hypothetical protein [Pseudochrobactrum asaccharolyticum]|jgi:hypothetical protein|nr:hypothetical protein [Pseudochrobactrum asaccharolyticum]
MKAQTHSETYEAIFGINARKKDRAYPMVLPEPEMRSSYFA